MKKVEKAGMRGIKQKRNPVKISGDDFFSETEKLRLTYSKLIDNPDPKRVVVIPSVSYGLANIAHNIPFNSGEILVTEGQFPSNVYPWMTLNKKGFRLKVVGPVDSTKRGETWNERILNAISEETRVVAMGHVHWSDGTLFHLRAIRKKLDEIGGLLILDGTQSIGALPFSIQEIKPDALICAGYKWLMGPYSIGLAYYGPAFDHGQPIEENWINREKSDDFANLVHYQDHYLPGSLKYEVGEHSNFILIPMLHQAIKQVFKWTPAAIQDYTRELMDSAIQEMKALGYLVDDESYRAHHLFGVRAPSSINLKDLDRALKKYRVSVSIRGDAIRLAPHVYNDEMDVRKLLKAMKEPIFA